jgi:hypothetical protein
VRAAISSRFATLNDLMKVMFNIEKEGKTGAGRGLELEEFPQ